MQLRLFDTYERRLRPFEPLHQPEAKGFGTEHMIKPQSRLAAGRASGGPASWHKR